MKIQNREIYAMDIVMIVGSMLVLLGAGWYARPLAIAPLDHFTTTNTSVLFSIERGNAILIDDNPEFTSPEHVQMHDRLVVTLQPGVHYWKVEGVVDSEIRKLVIASAVELRLEENGTRYEVVNAGNVQTAVAFYENESLLTSRVIDVHEHTATVGTRAEGRQHG